MMPFLGIGQQYIHTLKWPLCSSAELPANTLAQPASTLEEFTTAYSVVRKEVKKKEMKFTRPPLFLPSAAAAASQMVKKERKKGEKERPVSVPRSDIYCGHKIGKFLPR